MSLTCGNRWCTPCPNGWVEGATCQESDSILDQVEQYNREAQAALDVYDLMHPEDFFSVLRGDSGS